MKRKKYSKGSFNRVKGKDLLTMSDPNSPSISIDGENNMNQTGECQGKIELGVVQSTTFDNKISKTSSIDTVAACSKSTMKTGYGSVKVKLKASKLLEPHKSSSDVQMPNSNKSNSQIVPKVNEMTTGKVDITCSDSQTLAGNVVPENLTRKPASIKIKSSRSSDFSPKQIGSKIPHKGSCYITKELSAALGVIRKIMKMDAAVPFNAPVNPVALGIPDYFDIIDTPMDFGSICHDLEHGTKYKNSCDVFKDVQFIWDNCYKYNNKGDYILELMKRVKKNFMKYWTAAGLLTEMSIGISEGTQVEDVTWHHQDKSTSKIKSKHKRRRYGIDGHKNNCLCAVCVVRRRRKEREEHSAAFESHIMVSNSSSPNEPKLEVTSADNPCSEGTASSLDHSPETDADAEMNDAGKVETITNLEPTGSDEPEKLGSVSSEIELYTNVINNETYGNTSNENDASHQNSYDQECHHSDSSKSSDKKGEDENDRIKEEARPSGQEVMLENPTPQQENHTVLWLCKELFPGNQKSVWNGPHSLSRRHASAKPNSSMRSALATLLGS